jgi:diguanylate cyclase (GGDEF)-like protein
MDKGGLQDISGADIQHAVEVGNRIWWVGHYMPDESFQCHAYLIEHGDQSVLIDPGSYLTFKHTLQKVEEVIPFSHIRYFICHHQDPDLVSCLKLIDEMPNTRKDAEIVVHWRCKELLKHYDLDLPFWLVEEHDWQLDIGGRILKFIFTPYLHFPGAFCTFDDLSGVLFSSDLFGGFTTDWNLVARDESHFEAVRLFHEHYMPSREILGHSLVQLEKHPIKMIAPQHGSIIPSHLIEFMINKLKQVDCGLYALTQDITNIVRLSRINKALRDITHTVIIYRDFNSIAHALLEILRRTLPAVLIEFYANTTDGKVIHFAPVTHYRGEYTEPPPDCKITFDSGKDSWYSQHQVGYKKILLPAKSFSASVRGDDKEPCLLIPLFPHEGGTAQAVAILRLAHDIEIDDEVNLIVEQMSDTLGVAIERESLFRLLESERQKFYEQAIRDPLTGLYNRVYMEETLRRLFNRHDRNETECVVAILFDIDRFKRVNDTYGHGTGDKVLRKVALTLMEETRLSDLPVRFGGEEFVLFMIGQSMDDAVVVAEKLREKISTMTFEDSPKDLSITISVGVAIRRQEEPFEDFMHKVDVALYQAKNTGRNRVCVAE